MNNVDVEKMREVQKEISSKFEVVQLNDEVLQYNKYSLPDKVNMKINNIPQDVSITWDTDYVNTNNYGTYTFTGFSKEFRHTVVMTLKVRELIINNVFAKIVKVYEKDEHKYITLNPIEEYYTGEEAISKVIEVGYPESLKEDLNFKNFAIDTSETTKDYIVSDDCEIKILKCMKKGINIEDNSWDEIVDGSLNELFNSIGYYDNFKVIIKDNCIVSIIIDKDVLCISKTS